jgi:hypothetical protein
MPHYHVRDERFVPDVANLQRTPLDRLLVAGRQVIERNRHDSRPVQGFADVAADITGATGHQNGWLLGHRVLSM